MARLTSEQWEQARAEYEVRGVSLGEVARRFGVSQQAASKRARKEGWKQGKSCGVVEKKVSAIKALYEVEQESCDLPTTFRATIDDVVRERLEADHLFAQFDKALILKAHAVLSKVELPEEWETMTRGRRNLAPQQEWGTTVNRGAPQKSDRCDSYSTRRGEHTCPSERIMPRLSRPEWP